MRLPHTNRQPPPESEPRPPSPSDASLATHRPRRQRDLTLALGAIGVVYGDVGTNPLFALRECFAPGHGLALTEANILGSVSLAIWALMLVICIKYTVFVLRADNQGEGGALALLGKLPTRPVPGGLPARPFPLVVVLLFGAALLIGDGVVTPAISVLSAVEGLGIAQDRIVAYTLIILVVLFLVQRFGTSRVGAVFGPVMMVWFVSLAVLGITQIVKQPRILWAIDPRHAIHLLRSGQHGSYLVLGAIILCVGGGEALYADLGHFGRRPIVLAWYRVVLPALLLVYMGQGALLLRAPDALENPFFRMAPGMLRYPLVALATAATVIASQALISGSFSLVRQAVNLGYLPRLTIKHTSTEETGQIYVPIVNTILMCGCLALVIGFGSSSRLAAAYGLATNATMTATTIGFFFVMWRIWRASFALSLLLVLAFLSIDIAFLGANLAKLAAGGWVPLSIGTLLFTVAMIWRWGRRRLGAELANRAVPVHSFLMEEAVQRAYRHPGTAVFLTSARDGIPPILIHHFQRNGVLHEQVILLSIETLELPFVEPRRRMKIEELDEGFYRVVARFGYEEMPNVPRILEACAIHGLVVDFESITYILGHAALRLKRKHGLLGVPRRIYAFLARNQASTLGYFGMPVEQVLEIGMQLEL